MRGIIRKANLGAIIFIFILVVFLSPAFVFRYVSGHFHRIYSIPRIQDAVIDLGGHDFTKRCAIPLDGKWEFFYDRWIISEAAKDPVPDMLAEVPLPWSRYQLDGRSLPRTGRGSYRILLKKYPDAPPLTCHILGFTGAYRIYINGDLIAGRSLNAWIEKGIGTAGGLNPSGYQQFWGSFTLPRQKETELVIEVASNQIGGLYMTPELVSASENYINVGVRYFVAACYTGIFFILILGFAVILFTKDVSFRSVALLLLDFLVFLRILSTDEFYEMIRVFYPKIDSYELKAILQAATMFLPVVFLYCARQLVQIQISRKVMVLTAGYELAFSLLIYRYATDGRPLAQHLFCVISYLPFAYIFWKLFQCVRRGIPYSILVSAILASLLSFLIGANYRMSGQLVMNTSLYAPTCFVISVLLQCVMYMLKNREIQRQALAAERLEIKLRESNMSLMISQIKPHFLYNTLIAIHTLCLSDAARAAESILQFADFLRTNMRFINSPGPIPFVQELDHIRNYAAIEAMRFQERLTVQYDIQATNFKVPPLSVQPLVENAIKHGACKNIEGGSVSVRTYETACCYWIEIADDGPGFDTSILDRLPEQSVGLRSVLLRLKEAGAGVQVESERDRGTMVRVRIPKREEQQ